MTQPNPWPQELVDGFNDSPTPTPDGKTLVFDRMSIAAPNEIYTRRCNFTACRIAVAQANLPYSVPELPAVEGANR